MNIASIDIGTNTILLLIAKIVNNNDIMPLLNVYRMPRIGEGLINSGLIKEEKINLMIDVLNEYKEICKKYNCDKIILFATQAMRAAKNNTDIIKKVLDNTGLSIEIIPGQTEAQLSFNGAVAAFKSVNSNKVVIDIGGGSTEIIYGNSEKIIYSNSFKFGVVTLTESLLTEIPYSEFQIKDLYNYVNANCVIPFSTEQSTSVIAISGTPTSLSCMKQLVFKYSDEVVENTTLDKDELDKLINDLSILTPQQALAKYGQVLVGRSDVILAGAIILQIIREKLNASKIIVSTQGLRHGIIYNYLGLDKGKNQE